MKILVIIILAIGLNRVVIAQSAEDSYHLSANLYVNGKDKQAANTLDNALKQYPSDPKLNALRGKIKEEEKQEQEEQQNQEGEQSEEQQSEEQKSEQQQGKGEQSEEQSEQDAEQSESEEGQEGEEMPPSVADKLKEMNITEEKARMILEAMRNNEMQYIQQNRRKPQQPRDRTKPDW